MTAKLKTLGGIGLLIIGVLGLVLPILPGIPFLIAGAAVLGTEHPLIRPFKRRIDRWRRQAKDSPAEESAKADLQDDEPGNHKL